jgi:hypothetical protein
VKQEFEVSVEELLRTLQRRGVPLPSEMGAFITLEVCEQIIDRPALLTTQDVAINEIGEVLCAVSPPRADEAAAVRALLALLGDLLVCAAPGVPTMLLELVERGPSEDSFTLDRLRDDLEACLLPLNRGATRRVLARLLREARKAAPSSQPSLQPNAADMDADIDALLGAAPRARSASTRAAQASAAAPLAAAGGRSSAAERPGSLPANRRSRQDTPVTVPLPGGVAGIGSAAPPLAAFGGKPGSPAMPSGAARSNGVSHPVREPAGLADELEPADEPSASEPADFTKQVLSLRSTDASAAPPMLSRDTRRRAAGGGRQSLDTDDLVEVGEQRSRAGLWVFAGSIACALGLVAVYLGLGKEGVRSALGLLPQPRAAEVAARSPFVGNNQKHSVGELRVTSNLGRAQVLLLIGAGPALATDLPVGVAQEFVALADGYAPARAIVPADAVWEEVDGKPRYELAIQATRASAGASKMGLGPTLLPRDVGTPQAKLGSVRVVTTPKGAKVYQLIGFTPDVRVENLPLDQDYDVLVYLEGRPPVSRHVEAADFEGSDGKRVCELDVTLSPAKER